MTDAKYLWKRAKRVAKAAKIAAAEGLGAAAFTLWNRAHYLTDRAKEAEAEVVPEVVPDEHIMCSKPGCGGGLYLDPAANVCRCLRCEHTFARITTLEGC